MKRLLVDGLRVANRRLAVAPLLRRAAIRAHATLMSANVFLPGPRVLLNGPAKSGTHLLADAVSLMPRLAFSGRHFALTEFVRDPAVTSPVPVETPLDEARLRRVLRLCRPGCFATAHASWHPTLEELLAEQGVRHVLLLRDPRDLVVSRTHFVLRERTHPHHRLYSERLSSFDERLAASIRGFPAGDGAQRPLPSIRAILESFLPWLERDGVLVTRFEALVGERGGGDPVVQRCELQRVAAHLDRRLGDEAAERLAKAAYSERGFTFRKGRAGSWPDHFSDENRRLFESLAGDLLEPLGYERDRLD